MNLLKLWTSRAIVALIVVLIMVGLAYSFPLDLAFLMAIDLGTWVEAAVAVYVVTNVTRIRPVLAMVRAWIQRLQRSRRRTRTSRLPKKVKPSNDDKPAPSLSIAA